MKTNVMTLLAPQAGLNFSLPADLISEMEMSQCQNVRIEEGRIKKKPGNVTLGNNLPFNNSVIGLFHLNLYSGTDYLLACTTKAVYYLADPTGTPYWETLMGNEVIQDCEDNLDWVAPHAQVTLLDDDTDEKVGTNCLYINITANFTTGHICHYDNSFGDKSAYTFVRFWIKSSVACSAGDISFKLYDTAGGAGEPTNETEELTLPALTANTWTLVFLQVSAPSTTLDACEAIGLTLNTDLGAQVIKVDDIRLTKAFTTGATYNASNNDLMTAEVVRDTAETEVWWVMTNQVDSIQKWTGSTATALAALGGSPPVCEHLIGFKDYLLLLDITNYRQRVQWPDTADFEDWSTGNSGSQDLTGPDFVMNGVRFKGDYVVIAKKSSIWLGYPKEDNNIFQFDQRVSGIGTVGPKTLLAIGDIVAFLGLDDVYSFDGIDCTSIGEKIRDELVIMQNPKQIAKSFSYLVMDKNEYHLVLPSSSSTYPDREYVWNYNLNSWTKYVRFQNMTCACEWQKQTSKTIGQLVGTIGAQNWRIGERWNLASTPTTVLGDVDGYVYEVDYTVRNENSTAIDAWFSTKDLNPTGLAKRWKPLRLDVYFTGDGLDVEYSTDKGASWTRIKSFGASTDLETPNSCYLKGDWLMGRLRFRNAEAGEHFEFSRANLYWQGGGLKL